MATEQDTHDQAPTAETDTDTAPASRTGGDRRRQTVAIDFEDRRKGDRRSTPGIFGLLSALFTNKSKDT